MAGGGVCGKVAGTAHTIIIGDGPIITVFRVSILTWTRGGEDTTGSISGTDTGGTMNGSLTSGSTRTGGFGLIIDTGKDKGPGASRAIDRTRSNRGRN